MVSKMKFLETLPNGQVGRWGVRRDVKIETSRSRDEEMSKGKEVMAPTTSLDNTKNLSLHSE